MKKSASLLAPLKPQNVPFNCPLYVAFSDERLTEPIMRYEIA